MDRAVLHRPRLLWPTRPWAGPLPTGAGARRVWSYWLPWAGVAAGATVWILWFGGLALARHAAGGTNAEDLGFTDQVLWNTAHGRWFAMTVYHGAFWNTEIDLRTVAHSDSLLAFHFEPMLLLLAPLYLVGADARWLLGIQALALGLAAVPAYALGLRWTGVAWAGVAVAGAYLLNPLLQWVVLSDFHTTAVAVPFIVFALERFAAGRPGMALASALVAMTAREDAALAVGGLGVWALLHGHRWAGGLLTVAAGAWSLLSVYGVVHTFSGGFSPLAVRYGPALSAPGGLLEALTRLEVRDYAVTLLGGGWLGLLAPPAWLPAVPSLALNVLSSSSWMASGKAHYSALVLPSLVAGSAGGLAWLRRLGRPDSQGRRGVRGVAAPAAAVALLVGGGFGYALAGTGPFGTYPPPAIPDRHAALAAELAAAIPPQAAVSATPSLFPRLSQRERIYVFPALDDAEYVFLDVTSSPSPTSAGDIFLRVQSLLASGDWRVERGDDGLLVLVRRPGVASARLEQLPPRFYTFVSSSATIGPGTAQATSRGLHLGGAVELTGAELRVQPRGGFAPLEPHGVLQTTWRVIRSLPADVSPEFCFQTRDGRAERHADLSALWWHPPERWAPGETVRIDVPNVPAGGQWSVSWPPEEPPCA